MVSVRAASINPVDYKVRVRDRGFRVRFVARDMVRVRLA